MQKTGKGVCVRVELLQDVETGLSARALWDLCQVGIRHEESFHAGVHVEPHMLPEGAGERQQQSRLRLTALNCESTLSDL